MFIEVGRRAIHAKRQPECAGNTGCCEIDAMDNEPVWEEITTAPYNRHLELAVIEGDHVYPLVFACCRTTSGWIKVLTKERVAISPTHWRVWHGKD